MICYNAHVLHLLILINHFPNNNKLLIRVKNVSIKLTTYHLNAFLTMLILPQNIFSCSKWG